MHFKDFFFVAQLVLNQIFDGEHRLIYQLDSHSRRSMWVFISKNGYFIMTK